MSRVNNSKSRFKHRKVLKGSKGFRGRAKSCFRTASLKISKGCIYSYKDRNNKSRSFRSLWIQRINAALKEQDVKYARFINKLIKSRIYINRKCMSSLAINRAEIFSFIVYKIIIEINQKIK